MIKSGGCWVFALLLCIGAAVQGRAQQQGDAAQGAVIPPAPIIIKRGPNAISVPWRSFGFEFEEHPAVNSGFGYRRDPFTRRARFHSGLDLKARRGQPVGASLSGRVQFAGWYYGYGNLVIIDHGGGITTHYAHLSGFAVQVGQRVERGAIIGFVGDTGRATSPHLHYEVRFNGNPLNPFELLALDPDSEFFQVQREPTLEPVELAPGAP